MNPEDKLKNEIEYSEQRISVLYEKLNYEKGVLHGLKQALDLREDASASGDGEK